MPRARVVLLDDGGVAEDAPTGAGGAARVALIERRRPGAGGAPPHRYFVFPGGGVERGETPEEAAVREAREELGLDVRPLRRVATVVTAGDPHHYFLVEAVGGAFGTGHGDEVTGRVAPYRGSYRPVWVEVGALAGLEVFARGVAAMLPRALARGWPARVRLFVTDGSDFPVYPP